MIKNQNKYYLKINLAFFDDGDKTENASASKKKKSRDEGQVAKSEEISTAILFIASFYGLKMYFGGMYKKILEVFNYNYTLLSEINEIFEINFIKSHITYMFWQIIIIVSPIFILVMVFGLIGSFIQVGWHPTSKPLKPKLSKLNPIKGMKNLFSAKVIVDLIKSIAKMALILYSMYSTILKEQYMIFKVVDMELLESVIYIATIAANMGINVGMMFLFIAVADYTYQKTKMVKDMKMTKQEVKEENKMSEGNPQIKSAIKQKMREASMKRMMQDLPNADVIITNPTHFAVAIKYDLEKAEAPRVIAKGADYLALKIKELGKENNIEIIENKQLARALYSTVEIGKEIPEELYQAVAEILAFVYKIKSVV